MDFESLREMLQSNDMEEVLAPQSADIFNIFCKKDGEHIDTIQALEDEPDNGRRTISPQAYRWLERALNSHRLQHQPDYHVSIYEGAAEPVSKIKY
jgi:hypothetical protein